MTVGDGKGSSMEGEAAHTDRFPVGMRVLAVDDDPVCLKLLECLLLRCQYHVTTTSQAITALKLLRENRDKFDLVISDVHMPDMDGFKLLELVGLEMDLPVIMLSVNGETKTVMKGITHGACDYLLKPVRIEELRNIWQHVVRRRKFNHRVCNSYGHREGSEKPQNTNSESGKGPLVKGLSDHNEKSSRKRKDLSDEDEDDYDENPPENEDPSTHKKPRVVWSIDLHRKFVAAVNQLGIDKAVPKRILELMNVDKLTRENVASHLQKYRLYLKRLSVIASQQANLVASFGGRDTSCLHMCSLDGNRNFQALATSGQLPVLTSCQTSGMLSRPSTTGLGFHGLAPTAIYRIEHTLNSTSIPLISKLQHLDGPANQQGSWLHGIPTSLELDQLYPTRIQEANSHLPVEFSDSGLPTGSTSFLDITNSSLLSYPQKQQRDSRDLVTPLNRIPSTSSDPYRLDTGSTSHLPDLDKCNNTWQAVAPLVGYVANDLSVASSTCDELSRIPIHMSKRPRDDNSISNASCDVIVAPEFDPFKGSNTKFQVNSFSRTGAYMAMTIDGESKILNFGNGHESKQKVEEPKQNHAFQYELEYSSLANISSCILSYDTDHGNRRVNFSHHKNIMNGNMISNVNASSSVMMQMPKADNLIVDPEFKYKNENIVEVTKSKSELLSNGCISDDLIGSMIKLERDGVTFMDNDINYDFYPLGACM